MFLKHLFLLIAASWLSLPASGATLDLTDTWVRATPPGKMMTAAYGVLKNPSDQTHVIIGVQTSVAGHSSIHETRIERDRSTMRPVRRLEIGPGETVTLMPGGLHMMLMTLSEPLVEGESIDICLELENNERQCSAFGVTKRHSSMHHH